MSQDFEDALAKLRSAFLDELPERFDALEQATFNLENAPADGFEAAFEELYRRVHSLKGSGGIFGLNIISVICHQLESFLDSRRTRFDGIAASAVLNYVDLLRQVPVCAAAANPDYGEIEVRLAAMASAENGRRGKALLIEPSNLMRSLYEQALLPYPIESVTAISAAEAAALLVAEDFDLLILSGELPDSSGTEMIAQLRRSNNINHGKPAILVTSSVHPAPPGLGLIEIQRDMNLLPALVRTLEELVPRFTKGRLHGKT